jgi:hypothetical protein
MRKRWMRMQRVCAQQQQQVERSLSCVAGALSHTAREGCKTGCVAIRNAMGNATSDALRASAHVAAVFPAVIDKIAPRSLSMCLLRM